MTLSAAPCIWHAWVRYGRNGQFQSFAISPLRASRRSIAWLRRLSAAGDCPDELWKQDSLVVTVIGDEFTAEIDGDRLTLRSMGGDGLIFRTNS